ncbi:unnamed protein product, partial [Penicillium discolor]
MLMRDAVVALGQRLRDDDEPRAPQRARRGTGHETLLHRDLIRRELGVLDDAAVRLRIGLPGLEVDDHRGPLRPAGHRLPPAAARRAVFAGTRRVRLDPVDVAVHDGTVPAVLSHRVHRGLGGRTGHVDGEPELHLAAEDAPAVSPHLAEVAVQPVDEQVGAAALLASDPRRLEV